VAQQLLEEAVRTRECPGIYFAEEPAGRTAKIMGTGLGVWEVMRDYVAAGEREDRVREIFPQLTPAQVGAARNYFLRYRDEIERRIAENAALTPEGVVARYPASSGSRVEALPGRGCLAPSRGAASRAWARRDRSP
jgi:uncharacterized protein (DUF433 family)